jgi:hypothetical protein
MLRYPTISSFVRYLEEGEFDMIIQRSDEKRQGKSRLGRIRFRRKKLEANVQSKD